ncbi:hypothetical protein MUB15_32390 [Priestia sp. OVS21]|nr:hypothetical protein [Priestia sp. OVS21]
MFNKIGLPKNLLWGYIGLTIFMIGDGVEQAWISPYLVSRGMSIEDASFCLLFMESQWLFLHGFLGFLYKH